MSTAPVQETSGYGRPSNVEEMQRLTERLATMQRTSKDYIVPANAFSLNAHKSGPAMYGSLSLTTAGTFNFTKRGLQQFAEKMGVPPKFAFDTATQRHTQRQQDSAEQQGYPLRFSLFALMQDMAREKHGNKYLIRTNSEGVRAVLSDSYVTVDNYDLMMHVGGLALEHQWQVRKMHIDDDGGRFYLELWAPDWQEIIGGTVERDAYAPAVVIANSEVGEGSLRIEPRAIRLICNNGLIASYTMRRAHIGEKYTESGVISDDTKSKRSAAIMAEARDYIFAAMDRDRFRTLLADIGVLQSVDLPDAVHMVEKVSLAAELPKEMQASVLNYLIMGGDNTAYGLLQALTRTAQDTSDVEVQMNIERTALAVVKKAVAV